MAKNKKEQIQELINNNDSHLLNLPADTKEYSPMNTGIFRVELTTDDVKQIVSDELYWEDILCQPTEDEGEEE